MAFILYPSFPNAEAKQTLDQPAIFPSKALTQTFELTNILPNHIAISPDKRLFIIPFLHTTPTLQLATLNNQNQLVPYPDLQWNTYRPNQNHSAFIQLTGMTLEDDRFLWVLDNGIMNTGHADPSNRAKLIKIDLIRNKIIYIYVIPHDVIKKKTFLNTIVVHRNYVYLADKGEPAIIVVNLKTNQARRLLENSSTLYSRRPIIVNNILVRSNSDENSQYNINQLALSPNGKTLYYQAMSGPLYRIDTNVLNDTTYTATELNEAMTLWLDTPTSGGITCGPDGSLYFNDIATNSIYRFTTQRILTKLIMDPRLKWSTYPFITKENILYVATLPFNPATTFISKKPTSVFPAIYVYKLNLSTILSP